MLLRWTFRERSNWDRSLPTSHNMSQSIHSLRRGAEGREPEKLRPTSDDRLSNSTSIHYLLLAVEMYIYGKSSQTVKSFSLKIQNSKAVTP